MKNSVVINSNPDALIRRYGVLIALLIVGLMYSSSVLAEHAGWVAQNIYFGYQIDKSSSNWDHVWVCSESGCGTSGVEAYELTTPIERISIDQCWLRTWSDYQQGNVCAAQLKWSVNGTTWSYESGMSSSSISGTNQVHWKKESINKIFAAIDDESTGPGSYTFRYLYEAKMNAWGTTCPDNYNANLDNGGENYQLKFVIPGFKGNSSLDYGEVKAAESPKKQTYTFEFYGFDECTASITGTDNDKFSLTSTASSNSVVLTEGSVDVYYIPSGTKGVTHTATLHLEGTVNSKTYSKDVTLTGAYVQDHPVTVLIADTAHVADGPRVTLQGYLKYAHCQTNLTTYGFYYSKVSCADITTGSSCKSVTATTSLKVGDTFTCTILSGLEENTTYYYKPFVKDSEDNITISDECGTFTTEGGCVFSRGDTIFYTIDASVTEDDPCDLKFSTIKAAFDNMVSHNDAASDNYWWESTTKMLQRHIVFEVAPGTYGTLNAEGEKSISDWIDFKNINMYSTTTTPKYYFIMRPLEASAAKPVIYGMNCEKSRWITIQGMNVQRTNTSTGLTNSAVLIGLNSSENGTAVGLIEDSRIKFIDCDFEGENFCCIHAHGVDGLYMENCNLVAKAATGGTDEDKKDRFNWGSSIKFMNCKNVTLLRNNFKGSHSQNIFCQNTQYMLVMDNVFWNDNLAERPSGSDVNNLAFIRLINYGADTNHNITNIGIYYNTLYLADNDTKSEQANFLTLGGVGDGKQTKDASKYDFATIDFMYNNCYSYDELMSGRTDNAFCGQDVSSTHMKTNNFWSKYDASASTSGFAFGSDTKHVSVPDQVCTTAPYNPEGLVIRGSGLNLGTQITTDISGLGGASINADRNAYNVRPASWTLGAYQQKTSSNSVHKIIWKGTQNSDWNNRNNWIKEDNTQLDCVDILAEDLVAIIPSTESETYGAVSTFPIIPEWDDPDSEDVRAGLGMDDYTPSKFVSDIIVEYGGAIKGVENLKQDGVRRYTSANSTLTVQRRNASNTADEWVLVGTVVKPFTSDKQDEVRMINSGDYYIENHEPHVYMQHVEQSGNNIVQGDRFTSLEVVVGLQSAYMIKVPDQYGTYKIPASQYYKRYVKDENKLGDGSVPKSFDFTGWYAADEGRPSFNLTTDGKFNFVNNYYPANLDVSALIKANDGLNAKYYDYTSQSWIDVDEDESTVVKPQNGFVLYSTTTSSVDTELSMYGDGSTKYRAASAVDKIKLRLENASDHSSSVIYIKTETDNLPKAFGTNPTTPELYVPDGENMYSTFQVAGGDQTVPLSIRSISSSAYSVKFILENSNGFDEVILEDRKNSATYDLNEVQPVFHNIQNGDLAGRFYLNVSTGTTTDVPSLPDSGSDADSAIEVLSEGSVITVSASTDLTLKKIFVSDMAGRTVEYAPKSANYSQHNLPVASGVYVVRVVADKLEYQQKVIIKD